MNKLSGLLLFLTLCIFCSSHAQGYDPDKVNKKAAAFNAQALEQSQNGNLPASIALLHKAIAQDPGFMDAYLSIAGMYGQLKNYDSAVAYYERAREIDTVYFKDYNLPYSINLAGQGEFVKALRAIDVFSSLPNLAERSVKAAAYRKRCYQFAVDYQKNNPDNGYHFAPVNLGDSVNTSVSEYFPALTINNQQLIFTRRVRGVNEDFFETDRRQDGKWQGAKALSGNINTNYNEGAQCISQDGQWLIFTGCNFPEGYGSCDLYISYLTPDGWSAATNMGNRINTDQWETSPSLSSDKRDLYFASKRFGGYGGSDIYVSHQLPGGNWSEPENLGPEINTPGDESCPFIHADNQTLYFTSNGHPGYGGSDLFLVRKAAGGKWSEPKNLGYPVNTIQDEGSLVITTDGSTAYYASDRADTRGGLDLYTFSLRNDIRPIKTLWIQGRVTDKKTGKGLPTAVTLTDLQTKEVIGKVQTDETGNYLITLPVGKDYALNVNRRGYLFFSGNFPLSRNLPDSTYHIDIALQPLEINAAVVLNNIFFDVNQFELKAESQTELENVIALMKDNPTLKVEITGYTDNTGKAADNLTLSTNRARSVVAFLSRRGIDMKRLSFQGMGEKQPVADNSTEAGKAKNRRTEMKVTGL